MKPQVLDLRVPVYLKASDLSQRIIRDAGLEPFWPNRKRKLYWMRARGRLLHDHETLQELGVIDNELIYILPQPLPEMGVMEQSPDYPKVNDYLGQGLPLLIFMLFAIISWSFCWGIAINASRHLFVSILPSMGVSVLCISFSLYLLLKDSRLKRTFFTLSIFISLISLSSLYLNYEKKDQNNVKYAIVFDKEIEVWSEPNKISELKFLLHEGTKVKQIDIIEDWVNIQLENGTLGWIQASSLRVLN